MKHLFSSCVLAAVLSGSTLSADTISEWLDAAHRAPNQQLSDLALSTAQVQSDAATAALYPKLTLIGSYEHFNAPTSLYAPSLRAKSPESVRREAATPLAKTSSRGEESSRCPFLSRHC